MIPLPVPQIARRMGLTRQSVHPAVHRMVRDGLLELQPNDDHRRSPLVTLTTTGDRAYRTLAQRQASWVNGLADGIDAEALQTAADVLERLSGLLEHHSSVTATR